METYSTYFDPELYAREKALVEAIYKRDVDGNGVYISDAGSVTYKKDGVLHRKDGPARIQKSGCAEWFQYGRLHRTDGPAVILPTGNVEWWYNGDLHRDDGPAIVGTVSPNGQHYCWYNHGDKHRADGPADLMINHDGIRTISWWWRGKSYTMDSWARIAGLYDTEQFVMLKLKYGC